MRQQASGKARGSGRQRQIIAAGYRALLAGLLSLAADAHALTEPAPTPDPGALLAMRNEARALEHGEGVARDPVRAAALYCEAARLGDAEAQFSLGWMYANGRGIARDDQLAAYFFGLAAAQQHPHASRMLRFTGSASIEQPLCMRDPTPPEPPLPDFGPEAAKVVALVKRLAPEYGIHPRLVLAVIRAESNFNAGAVSPKSAQGLMQLIPETSVRFNVRKPFDPEQNIRGGLAYLRWLMAYFRGNVALVAAAYNAGEGAVNRFAGIPPFAETRDYVKRITAIFPEAEHPFDPAVVDPSPELPRIQKRLRM